MMKTSTTMKTTEKMKKMERFELIRGDGLPYWTQFYRDTPSPFRLVDAWEIIDGQYDNLELNKEALIKGFDLKYGRYEINGTTYQDFKDLMQEKLYNKAETLDRAIGLMAGELYRPYEPKTETSTASNQETGTSEGFGSEVDVPKDNPHDDKDSVRTKSEQLSDVAGTTEYEKEESDYGFDRPYEIVHKFIKADKGINDLFNEALKDCFIFGEAWYMW